MKYRPLGSTGLEVSEISFGAGPVAGLMTGTDFEQQLQVLQTAFDTGINWIDTAAGYGNGASERALGNALQQLDSRQHIQIATKVRIQRHSSASICEQIRTGVTDSLQRLQRPHVTQIGRAHV